mmetsp:Transcript_3597/g.9209  ORF Transcript_3597/g.9209 Transcript_3597/m.9209 type:complete len:97 (+) Transcript_3597:2350-2640(+)
MGPSVCLKEPSELEYVTPPAVAKVSPAENQTLRSTLMLYVVPSGDHCTLSRLSACATLLERHPTSRIRRATENGCICRCGNASKSEESSIRDYNIV